jgi:acyl carrier protein
MEARVTQGTSTDERPIDREYVLSVVKRHLAVAVEEVDVNHLDTSRSMKEYGANSLDIVEVVSRTMRELKVKVPRTELSKLTNIDGLVDLLCEGARQQRR